MSRIPVIQLVDGFATEEVSGGAAQFGIQLARHLDRSRYAPFVCGLWRYNTPSENRWLEALRDEGIGTAILIDSPEQLSTDLIRATAYLRRLITRVKPRIINSHFERGDLLSLFCKIAHPLRPRIVRTVHTEEQWQKRPWLGYTLNLFAFPWLHDGEVAISATTKAVMDRRLASRLRRRHATLIYNGISSVMIRQLSLQATSKPTQRTVARLAIIGRLERQKGHADALAAFAKLREAGKDVELWVIGSGSLRAELEQLARTLGVAEAIHFLGQRSDIPELLAQVDILVSSSLWEGFPTVILEAMAAHVPVVATDVSGSRELVHNGETGLLVPARDPHALAIALTQLLDNPGGALVMAARAAREVQRYTLEHIAEEYEQLYQRVL